MKSWIDVAEDSDFSIYNIPFGIGRSGDAPFACTRIGDQVLNLSKLDSTGFFNGLVDDDFAPWLRQDHLAGGMGASQRRGHSLAVAGRR